MEACNHGFIEGPFHLPCAALIQCDLIMKAFGLLWMGIDQRGIDDVADGTAALGGLASGKVDPSE